MFNFIKYLFILITGVAVTAFFFIYSKDIKNIFSIKENIIPVEHKISSLTESLEIIKSDTSNFDLENKKSDAAGFTKAQKAVKLNFTFYNNNSHCLIEADVFTNTVNSEDNIPYAARVIAINHDSEAGRIECSRIAIDQVLPIILRGGYVGLVKTKIYEDGTIFKTLKPSAGEAKDGGELFLDGGFVVESLNGGLLLTESRFEVHITDCSIVKCGK